ncbi:MAG: FGGY family carbohydrate kinase [Chloroflexi bacterium]|nr:FGGY family carbohydrate kinase [Chloroflexota bacterium]
MAQEYLLGIDIGTQSSRASLLDLKGKVVANSFRPLDLQTPKPGWAEQDPQVWWDTTIENIREVIATSGAAPASILGVGVSGQMHGTVPLGPKGELLSHGVQLWCDKRSANIVEQFKQRPDAASAYLVSGTPPAAAWFGFKIKWVQLNAPDLYRRTWKFLVPKDYINYCLTGVAVIDHSEASGSFLMDAQRECWSEDIVRRLELDADKLPTVMPSSRIAGRVTRSAAQVTGLAEGTPVAAGGGDMLCGLLAAGITQPGRACDITGTASHLSVFTRAPMREPRIMNLHHVMPGWIPFGIIDSTGGTLKWFKDTFCQEEIALGQQTHRSPYAILDDAAVQVPAGAEGLLFFPYMYGERTLGTAFARGVFFGLTPRVGKGAIARAIMEGVTLELRRALEIIQAGGNVVDEVRTTGGGAQSALWSQIKADIYQKPVVTFETYEGSVLGAAILAGVGAGVYADEKSGADSVIRLGPVFEPNPASKARYDYLFEMFKGLHDRMQEYFNRYDAMP